MSRISRKCARLRQAFLGAFQAPDFESVVRRSPAVSGAEIKEPFRRLERPLGPYAAPQWLEASKQSALQYGDVSQNYLPHANSHRLAQSRPRSEITMTQRKNTVPLRRFIIVKRVYTSNKSIASNMAR
jgi:hypothetical protein